MIRRLHVLVTLMFTLLYIRVFDSYQSQQKMNKAIYTTLYDLGGVYIKFLQVLALKDGFLRGWSTPADLSVFEQVPYEPLDVSAMLHKTLGAQSSQFSTIQQKPFAAGSFAQVYKATLRDGTPVVIKVLRPSVARYIRTDLWLLRVCMRLIVVIKPLRGFDLYKSFLSFLETTKQECDYTKEAATTQWFYDAYKNNPRVVIPQVYSQLSHKTVLTMDYIDGISLADVMAQTHMTDISDYVHNSIGSNIYEQLCTLSSEVVHSIIAMRYMLCDAHPGNVKLLPNDAIGIIDFGNVSESPPNKQALVHLMNQYKALFDGSFNAGAFLMSVVAFFDTQLAQSLRTLESYIEQSQKIRERLEESADKLFTKSLQSDTTAKNYDGKYIIRIFMNNINQGNRFGLKLQPNTTSMLRALRTNIQLVRQLIGNDDTQKMIQYVLQQQSDFAAQHPYIVENEEAENAMSFTEALEVASEWLSHVADADYMLYSTLDITSSKPHYA